MAFKIGMDLSGKDEVLLAKVLAYRRSFFKLDKFRMQRPDHLSEERMDEVIGAYQQHFEGGRTGNRIEIGLRNKARKALTDLLYSALHFLQCIATEEDVPQIQEAGFDVRFSGRRKTKKVAVPALAVAGGETA